MQSPLFLLLPDPLCTRYMEFVCKNRAQCLFQSLVCDGIKHCEDGSDEDAEYAGCGEKHEKDMPPFEEKKTPIKTQLLNLFLVCLTL